ncbi:MAG TPA: hypothetical protein VF116_14700 [Ktedonobacterales bacterium]
MTWSDLDWPDLSPRFPMPVPRMPAPPRPDVPAGIVAQVRHAERRRGCFVPVCVLAGALLFAAGLARYATARTPGPISPDALALVLMLIGLLVATLLPALVVLLVIGPSWRQRQQHLRLLLWQRERATWLERERAAYLASLPPPLRAKLRRVLPASAPIARGLSPRAADP